MPPSLRERTVVPTGSLLPVAEADIQRTGLEGEEIVATVGVTGPLVMSVLCMGTCW